MNLLNEVTEQSITIEYYKEHNARYTRTMRNGKATWVISSPNRKPREVDNFTSGLLERKRVVVRRQG